MATEIGLLSLTQLQQLPQPQENQNQPNPIYPAWMWNNTSNKQPQIQDNDSWEVRAFEEDTGNIMGTTWPPRSYTCTFCRREFRSAQALGGHMNIHRRDRARLRQTQPIGSISSNLSSTTSTSSSPSTFIIPTQEFSTNGGLCLLYQLPNPNARVFTPTTVNACAIDSPSTLLTVSPYHHNNLIRQSISFPAAASPSQNTHSSQCSSGRDETSTAVNGTRKNDYSNNNCKGLANEELDLELRLGHKSAASPSSSFFVAC